MFLTPGDSPIGLRLPLESIEWVPPEEREIVYERDPLEATRGKFRNVKGRRDSEDKLYKSENGEAQKFFRQHCALNRGTDDYTFLCHP